MHQQKYAFENMVGKEEIVCNEQFLLFPPCFLLNQKIVSPFFKIYEIISVFAADLEEPKIGIRGKGLNSCYTPLPKTNVCWGRSILELACLSICVSV